MASHRALDLPVASMRNLPPHVMGILSGRLFADAVFAFGIL